MHTDRDFLATIDTRPDDRAFRLIYADWLEERNDPRGELIRVEEEMRQLPVYSDPFWALKPRRNELRSQADADWLARMKYGSECEPVFRHGVPDGWRERWRLIREFTERWYRKPMPDVGGHQDEIRETERRLGRALPPSIREWVDYAYDVSPPEEFMCVHRDGYTMEELPGHPALSLLIQAEGDYHWAVQYADLRHPDPPVYGYHWDYEREDETTFIPSGQNPYAASVTEFALGYTMSYLHGAGGGYTTSISDPGRLIRDLTASFPACTRLGITRIFEANNFLARLHCVSNGSYMQVTFFRPMLRGDVPACLWEYTPDELLIPRMHR